MLYKKLARHAQPASVLLKRAQRRALTNSERAQPPQELGSEALQVGDVLVDVQGGFLVIDAAPEPVIALHGESTQLMQALYALGLAQLPVMIEAQSLLVLPGDHVHALEHELGLSSQSLVAAFIPAKNLIAEHEHHYAQHTHHHDCGHHHDHDEHHCHHEHEHPHKHARQHSQGN